MKTRTEFILQLSKIAIGLILIWLVLSWGTVKSEQDKLYMVCGGGQCWASQEWKLLPFNNCIKFIPPEDEAMVMCGSFTINLK